MTFRCRTMILVAVALVAALVGCGKKEAATIKIGQAVALTGGNSVWGQPEKNTVEMEIAKINAKGGVLGKQLEMVAYDTRGDANEGVTVLLAEQNAFQALDMADDAFVLETGRVLVSGSGKEFLENPLVHKAYLGVKH